MKNLQLVYVAFIFFFLFSFSAIAGEGLSGLFLQQSDGGESGSTSLSTPESYSSIKGNEDLPRGSITLVQPEPPPQSITQTTIDGVRKVHPDFDVIVQSNCLAEWAETLSVAKRIYYADIMRNGSEKELTRMMNDYKQNNKQQKVERGVLEEHTDFYSVLVSPGFQQWLGKQSEEIRGTRETGSLSLVSAVLTQYKAETSDIGKPAPKKKRLHELIRERNQHLFANSNKKSW